MSKLAKNVVSNSLIIFKIFSKKILKLFLCYQIFGLKAMFSSILLQNYHFKKKQDSKKDLIWPVSSTGLKIILILLIIIIAA